MAHSIDLLKFVAFYLLVISILIFEYDINAQVLSPAEQPVYSVPLEHQILSSSQYQNYRFRDPFRVARVNSRGNQFVIDEVNRKISFRISEIGPTNSAIKNLFVIVKDLNVDLVTVQHGYHGQKQRVHDRTPVTLPGNSIWGRLQYTGGILVPVDAWNLGSRNWNDDIFVEIHYSGNLPSESGISLFVNNPKRFSSLTEELTEIMFSPLTTLLHFLGESSMYHLSFVNYEVQLPANDRNMNFAVTQYDYGYRQNWQHAINNELGNEYRVADWNDLIAYYESGGNLSTLFRSLGISERESVFVTRNGASHFSNNRAYFASFHRHNRPPNYLDHDGLNRNEISLGSWDGNRRILVIRR